MTLKELIEKHGFGVWLAHHRSPNEKVFKPLSYSENSPDHVIGEHYQRISEYYPRNVDAFTPYQEPKKKEVRWKWRVFWKDGDIIDNGHLYTVEQADEAYDKILNIKYYEKLEHTREEFEVEA